MATIAPERPGSGSARAAAGAASGEHAGSPDAARRRRGPSLDLLFTAVFALFGWGVGIERLSDNSFFWHLRTGQYILDHGIPHRDVFSFSAPGTKWVAQSWLAETAYALLDRAVGPFGIRLLGAVTGAVIGVLAYRLARRHAGERMRAACLTVAALAGLYTLWSERPLLLGVALFLCVIWTVTVPDSLAGRRPLIALPVLFWLWTNVHGSFALGYAFVALYLAGRWIDGHGPWQGRERTLTLGTAIAFVAGFANPYGVSLVTFPVNLLQRGDILRHVIEWASPDFHHVRGQSFALWLAVFAWVAARGRHRMTRGDLVVAVPFLVLALWALRNVAIAPLACLPIAARAVAVAPVRTGAPGAEPEGAAVRQPVVSAAANESPGLAWALLGVLLVLALAIGGRALGQPDFVFKGYSVRALEYVDRHGLLGERVLTDDADGGYVILRYWPDQLVYMDDRYDMYPRPVIQDYFTISSGAPGWQHALDRRRIDVVVWNRGYALAQLLHESDAWRRVYNDSTDAVYVRVGSAADR